MPHRNNPTRPLFSVIIPAYNVADYLPQCIDSVLSQGISNLEIILVDDGSTDRTGEICDRYGRKSSQPSIISQNREKVNRKSASNHSVAAPTFQVIHQSNSGLSAARNAGVSRASGEYLIFLDGDDYLAPDALTAIQRHLEPELDLLRYQAREIFADGREIPHVEPGFSTTLGVAAFSQLASFYYTENAWLYAYRRAFFTQNHFQYAEGCLAEDFGLTPLIIACAQTVKAIPDICYNYRQRTGSIMHDPAKISRRITDIAKQLQHELPLIAAIPGTAPILHYLVVSFLTGATALDYSDFRKIYSESKRFGFLQYIHPAHLRALPRAFVLKHLPRLFYRLYHH